MKSTNKCNVSCKTGNGLISSIESLPGKTFGIARNVVGTVLNRAVDLLPFEAHIPGYQYCGPGTKLKQRLERGDLGINPLDKACKAHDIAYSIYNDSRRRAQADKELAERAWQRVSAPDSSIAEKAAAWAVTNAMKIKSKFGGRLKKASVRGVRKKTIRKKGKGAYLEPYRSKTGCGVKKRRSAGRSRRRRRRRQGRKKH